MEKINWNTYDERDERESVVERKINENHIIDNLEIVETKLNDLVEGHIDIIEMINFINSENNTTFYFDKYLAEKPEGDEHIQYAWIDSGYLYKNEPIFISLVNYDGKYYGHFVGIANFLSKGLIKNNGHQRDYTLNVDKFKKKYNKKIEQRTKKCLEATSKGENMIPPIVHTEIEKLLNKYGYQVSTITNEKEHAESTGIKIPVQSEMTSVTEEIYNNLLYPSWKSIIGLDRYIKIIGRRVEQLVASEKKEYYVSNKIRSVVVNTGLMDSFGNDYLVLYKLNEKYKTYVAYQIMSGKRDYLDNDFTKEQASAELKPIQFLDDENMFFEAKIEEFDINQRCLAHIIEERRVRFPENIQKESSNRITAKLMDSLQRGLKIQMRDRSYAKLSYSGKDGQLSWILPLHINNEFTREPELVMMIRKEADFYEIKTILPYDDDMKDKITAISLYRHLW